VRSADITSAVTTLSCFRIYPKTVSRVLAAPIAAAAISTESCADVLAEPLPRQVKEPLRSRRASAAGGVQPCAQAGQPVCHPLRPFLPAAVCPRWLQRFSEMIRAVTSEGPQVITRHGEDVAVVVDIGEYRRLTRPAVDLASILLGGPKLDDGTADVFAEIEAERKADFGRAVDLEAGT
jgi:prevent-host-death family protein